MDMNSPSKSPGKSERGYSPENSPLKRKLTIVDGLKTKYEELEMNNPKVMTYPMSKIYSYNLFSIFYNAEDQNENILSCLRCKEDYT